MFDIGWTEMLVLGIVTLLAVGPRELPGMLRTMGRYVGQIRNMASDFRSQMDDVAEEMDARAQLKALAKDTFGDENAAPDLFDPQKFSSSYPDEEEKLSAAAEAGADDVLKADTKKKDEEIG